MLVKVTQAEVRIKMKVIKEIFRIFKSIKKRALRKYCEHLLKHRMFGYEERLQNFYQNILEKGDIVVDVGAHSGRHTIPLAFTVGPEGKVITFEKCRKI